MLDAAIDFFPKCQMNLFKCFVIAAYFGFDFFLPSLKGEEKKKTVKE